MPADAPINLNRARKARARADRKAAADANAAKFGRTRAERAAEATRTARDALTLDGHRIDRDDDGTGD